MAAAFEAVFSTFLLFFSFSANIIFVSFQLLSNVYFLTFWRAAFSLPWLQIWLEDDLSKSWIVRKKISLTDNLPKR